MTEEPAVMPADQSIHAPTTRLELHRTTESGQIEGRLIGLLRQPKARLAIDGELIQTLHGVRAATPQHLDDPAAGTFSVATPMKFRDDAPHRITVQDDRAEIFHEAPITLPRQISGRITACDPTGAIEGVIEVSGLRTTSLAARLVINGERSIPFLLGPGDMARDEIAGVTQFSLKLRLPTAERTGAPAALALALDEATGLRVLDKQAFPTRKPAQGRPYRRSRVKRLVIVETSLTEARGHMISAIDICIRAARGMGLEPLIAGHRKFDGQTISGVKAIGAFSQSLYDIASMPRIGQQLDAYKGFKDDFAAGLATAMDAFGAEETLFFYPTVNEYLLSALADALEGRPFAGAEHHLICLMLETGLLRRAAANGVTEVVTLDPVKTELFRDAFAALNPQSEANRKSRFSAHVHLAATSETHRLNYQELSAATIHTMPPMYGYARKLDRITADESPDRQVLLYLGEAKNDKGFLIAPAVARALIAKHPDLRLVAQIHNIRSHEARMAADALRALAGPNLRLIEGFLDRSVYMGLLAASDAVVIAYSPQRYAGKTSGVLWEAVSFAAPVVVPAQTWLEQEAARSSVAYESFAAQTVDDVAAAVDRLLQRTPPASTRTPARDMFVEIQSFFNDTLSSICAAPTSFAELFDPVTGPPALDNPPDEGLLVAADEITAADDGFVVGWGAPFKTEYQRPGRWMSSTGVIRLDIDRAEMRALRIFGERLSHPGLDETLTLSVDGMILDETDFEVRNARDFIIHVELPPRRADAVPAPTWIELSVAPPNDMAAADLEETLLVNAVSFAAARPVQDSRS